jgi:multidrug resistance efflux pump/soluble P-type ATPase
LLLAAPPAFVAGTSLAARRGVLIKGGGPLEALATIRTVLFDKTGTLTVGGARLVAIETASGTSANEALRLAASLEQASHHVLAATIVAAARGQGLRLVPPQEVRETLGSGLEGQVEGRRVAVGSLALVHGEGRLEEWARRAARRAAWRSALTVFVAVDGRVVGVLLFADELRRETPRAIQAMRGLGVDKIVMLTGDRAEAAETIAAALDLNAVLAERIPADKVDAVATERRRAPTLMVGDGINDAPALAAATVGVAMGAAGASASSEAADVVVLVDRLDRVAEAVAIARRTRAIALQSIVVGMTLSGVAMVAAAFGYLTPVAGAVLQEVIDVAVILNALRALSPIGAFDARPMPEGAATQLRDEHLKVEMSLERLRQIANALDEAEGGEAIKLIREADRIVQKEIVPHERADEEAVYPLVSGYLHDAHGLGAMSRAHREIMHQARLLARLAEALQPGEVEAYLVRDAQRIVESIESLVHIHNAQEEDIYDHAAARVALAPRRTRWRVALAGGAVACALAVGAFVWSDTLRSYVGELRASAARSASLRAEIGAVATRRIEAKVPGVVVAVYCSIGASVKAGDLCAALDAAPYQSAVERAQAARDEARRRLDAAKQGPKPEEPVAEAPPAPEEKAPTVKGKPGGKAKPAPKPKPPRAAATPKPRGFGEDAVDRKNAAIERETENLAESETALNMALAKLDATKIVAPADGLIVARSVTPGASVAEEGARTLFLLAEDIGAVRVATRVDARALGALGPGDTIRFTVETFPGRSFEGEIVQLAKAQRSPGAIDLVIVARNDEQLLKPGSAVRIKLSGAW